MKSLFILMFLFGSFVQVFGQKGGGTELEFKYSFSKTSHLNNPVDITKSFEGGEVFEQLPRWKSQYETSINRFINSRLNLKYGIGLTRIEFQETKQEWIGIFSNPYRIISRPVKLTFASFIVGARFKFKSYNGFVPHIGNELILDVGLTPDRFENIGASLKSYFGFGYQLTKRISLIADLSYKGSVTPYNRKFNYYPMLLGGEIGLNILI